VKASEQEALKVYHFGVFAYLGEENTRKQFEPIIEFLNARLKKERIELHVLDQERLYQWVDEKRLDFVTTNPTHYLVIRKKLHLSGPIATWVKLNNGQPLKQLAGVIITKSDRLDIKSLSHVRNKVIAIPGEEFMGGYRAQAYELYLAGIDLPKHAKELRVLGSHYAVIDAVINGEAEVGFIRDGVLERLANEGRLNPNDVKVLNAQLFEGFPHRVSTRLYPEWPVFALPHVAEQVQRHLASALLALEPTDKLAIKAGVYGFSIPADYLGVEDLSRALRLPPFDELQPISLLDIWDQYTEWVITVLVLLTGLTFFLGMTSWLNLRLKTAIDYSRDILESQSVMIIVNNGVEIVDVSGGFFEFFSDYRTIRDFQRDYHCICDMFVKREGYLFNESRMEWIDFVLANQDQDHKAIIRYKGQDSVFKVDARFSKKSALYIATLTNITHQELMNEEIRKQKQAAIKANQAKSEFLANMSHEIRTPMNGIIGMSELGLKTNSADKKNHFLNKVNESGRLLLGIINDILDFSKIEAGKLEINPQPFLFADLLEHIRSLFEPMAEKKGIVFHLQVDENLLKAYVGDELRIRQILTNLVSNAIKFTEQGEVRLRIVEVDGVYKGLGSKRCLRFSVLDTGVGMTPEQQRRLFQPFSQGDSSVTRQYGGTGLGLVICRQLLKAMGGTDIELNTAFGKGSSFSFQLSLVETTEQEYQSLINEATRYHTQQSDLQGRILLVEDNLINQEVAAEQLKLMGLIVTVADNGEMAVDKARRSHYDLILMDIQMPVMDGYLATQKIREFDVNVPIIALTAAAMFEDREKAINIGMNDHLSKPIDNAMLYQTLSKWLSQPSVKPQMDQLVVLLDEDKSRMRACAARLSKQGHVVKVANTIERAQSLWQTQKPTRILISEALLKQATELIEACVEKGVEWSIIEDEEKSY
jgi:signal transduction histidine kinase/CheY-like chemotaxis protein/ABC-type phosphate/phosphonate transport system substrate-binding protein